MTTYWYSIVPLAHATPPADVCCPGCMLPALVAARAVWHWTVSHDMGRAGQNSTKKIPSNTTTMHSTRTMPHSLCVRSSGEAAQNCLDLFYVSFRNHSLQTVGHWATLHMPPASQGFLTECALSDFLSVEYRISTWFSDQIMPTAEQQRISA